MTNEEIQQIFFVECEEALAAAEAGLDAARAGSQDGEAVNSVFRAVHSIKGGAGAFGFTALQAFAHGFETLLSDVRDGTLPTTEPLVALLLRALDMLSDHVTAARDDGAQPADGPLLAELAAAQAGQAAAAPAPAAEAAPAPAPEPEPVAEPVAEADPLDDMDFDLDALLDDVAREVAEPDAPITWRFTVRPRGAALANGGEPVLLLRELSRMGGQCVRCDIAAIPRLDMIDPGESYLAWTFEMPADVTEEQARDVFDFFGDEYVLSVGDVAEEAAPEPEAVAPPAPAPAPEPAPAPVATPAPVPAVPVVQAVPAAEVEAPRAPEAPVAAAGQPAAVSAAGQTIRIDLAKLDRLIDSVGELVIAQAMLAQRMGDQGLEAIEELSMLEGLTRDIQESAMSIRAQPISAVFSRVPRLIRELEASTGKQVTLEVVGETTELDKTVIERLGEPMTHLIRNACDHGLETPEQRVAAGKPAQGTLRLSAEQRSGRILIRIADDGRGIDREKVLAKAVERGLVPAGAQLSNDEIYNLIFAPGFSTAEKVSNISGRGVGMDVVRQNVKDLGGRITIESEPGKGSCFTLALPLTLAISDGMIVTVGDQTLVVPLANVVESLRPEPKDLQRLGAGRQMLNVRGQFIPVIRVDNAAGARGAIQDPSEGVLIVVDTEAAGQAALQVDTILDQRQFVIKSLDTNFRQVRGVVGATILGDGRVALILDVDGLAADAVVIPEMLDAA